MTAKAASLGPELTADYTICHHNWQYDFLLPEDDEAVAAYQRVYGPEASDSDADSSGSEGCRSWWYGRVVKRILACILEFAVTDL